jgi:hypothetical protein
MLGMDQGSRSNAVGHQPAYLPDGDPGRHGGSTYTGTATEPTIQDYENFFGPSARDIKTDLQRFKRHGRWHLPDILKGPNPWLTDRIDGLITDATNSPFTTKILPYRYKDEVDGKIKWNVWNFDEGMASRVPYESAARTLQQSKRSFAGYMIRQGMAIVLEHNFMMTPKGRENFKNQLNQLIGSIQYTNDLDVHMALVMAPSYQKTMRERYYTLDKSSSQICREYVDLFGMMQKNVNALDILIEEGKAILRTWGGPMPDFLLCNSKLTFQMTMTPEKTNYITQGTDGVKRLRQGPDLGSYRGLSVIHSRSFAMEVGQHPRDILRRRVRTAEYYRILPDKNNSKREFEFYNEERDTWFTLTFQDLLRYARYPHDNGSEGNPAAIDRVFNSLSKLPTEPGVHHASSQRGAQFTLAREASGNRGQFLGAKNQTGDLTREEILFLQEVEATLDAVAGPRTIPCLFEDLLIAIGPMKDWALTFIPFDLGVKHVYPKGNRVWAAWEALLKRKNTGFLAELPRESLKQCVALKPRLGKAASKNIYHNLKNIALNDPFQPGTLAAPRTPDWFAAFAFYIELYNRSGIPLGYFDDADIVLQRTPPSMQLVAGQLNVLRQNLVLREPVPAKNKIDITVQLLQHSGARGSVNHPFFLRIRGQQFDDDTEAPDFAALNWASRFLLTYEILGPLLREYKQLGGVVTGIEYLKSQANSPSERFLDLMARVFDIDMYNSNSVIENTQTIFPALKTCVDEMLSSLTPVDPDVIDAVYLARNSIHTWPMNLTSNSHVFHPKSADNPSHQFFKDQRGLLTSSYNHLNRGFIEEMAVSGLQTDMRTAVNGQYWFYNNLLRDMAGQAGPGAGDKIAVAEFWDTMFQRLTMDPAVVRRVEADNYIDFMPRCAQEILILQDWRNVQDTAIDQNTLVYQIANTGLETVSIDMNQPFHTDDDPPPLTPAQTHVKADLDHLQDVEIVIVRPNIEHNMLGVIMGLGGDSLGNTLWGQTELSVYDDSMHGIWGMSYKYHERAIVFNEKNLIRLWDIAYDGYNGGKDDTYVDWIHQDAPNGVLRFQELTLDVSKNYRGPSMMVMAFVHDRERRDVEGSSLFDKNFKRNWPSPIVFHDNQTHASHNTKETLPVDYDNLQVIDVEEFRVFNNPLYSSSYTDYRNLMPHFHEMHMMRKTAGQSSADSETHTDSLAFQGSMRIKENGIIVQEIHGSGHHGPDYTGVASVRAGKGQKTAGQAPTLHRLI